MSSTNLNSKHGLGGLGGKAFKLEQDFTRRHLQTPTVDSRFCSTPSINPAPICRQFWKAGNYDEGLSLKPTGQNSTGYLRIHPKFLHSNATSHKWAFGAMAELLDNSVDEVQNGATFVNVDKTLNPRDGAPALLIQDDGGGMDPEAMRRCLSFGFSDKKSQNAIGKYGNGFKTSSMRLGADVVVFSRCKRARRLTQSVGLLSYTFLMQTGQDRIVVPMVDYQFDTDSGTWKALQNEQQFMNNLSVLLQWSPVATEAELFNQCDDIGPHGTKIIVYNLWHSDEGKMELDFESDPEDIRLSKDNKIAKVGSHKDTNEQQLANRIQYSLRAYLSVLYLHAPKNFYMLLRGRVVEYHNIANDLKFVEFIMYRPQSVEGSVTTTIGFLKEAPAVNIHGFNVYHKNRLIMPFWHVVTYSSNRGRGIVGILEANFIEPTHNKQDFEKTPVFQKLEVRLKDMTNEYWDCHCGLLGYQFKKLPQPNMTPYLSTHFGQGRGIYQPVVLGKDSPSSSNHVAEKSRSKPSTCQNLPGDGLKRKGDNHIVELERVEKSTHYGQRRGIYQPVVLGKDSPSSSNHVAEKSRSTPSTCQNSPGDGLKRKGDDHIVELERVEKSTHYGQRRGIYQPVVLRKDSPASSNHVAEKSRSPPSTYQNSPGDGLKRKGDDHIVELERVEKSTHFGQRRGIYQPVVLGKDFPASSNHVAEKSKSPPSTCQNSPGAGLKRKGDDHIVELERVENTGAIGPSTTNIFSSDNLQHSVDPAKQLENQEADVIQENQNLRVLYEELEKTDEELNRKITRLRDEVEAELRKCGHLLLEKKSLEKVERGRNKEFGPV